MEKIDVNGDGRHPIYEVLTEVADSEGHTGDIRWNFEKFLITPDGTITRYSPMTAPDDPALVAAIEASLYRWRASGKPLETLRGDQTFDITIRLLINTARKNEDKDG